MKMKLKLDGPTIQNFLFRHVEKIVLGVVVLLLAAFVYLGTRLEGMTDLKSPEKLMEMTRTTKTQLNREDAWKDFQTQREVVRDVPERVGKILQATDPTEYAVHIPWSIPDFPKQMMRGDPKVYAPLHVRVTAIQGPLAIKRELDGPGGPGGSGMAGPVKDPLSGDLPVGMNNAGGGENVGRREVVTPPPAVPGGKKKDKNKGPGFLEDYGPSENLGMAEMPMMNSGGPREGSAHTRTEGYLPGGADGTFVAAKAVVVMAAVPWEQQFDEYQRVLAEALDFRPERDFPNYLGYYIERADVTADPSVTADKIKTWESLSYNKARSETYTWQGFPSEIIDPDWCDLALTHPAPPFLFRDLTPALRHAEFPLLADVLAEMQAASDPRAARGAKRQQPGESQYGFDAVDPMSPENSMQPGMNGMTRTITPFQHKTGGSQPGSGPGRMEGALSGPGGSAKALGDMVRKYKLLRFTDTTLKQGKTYRYRVKVVLEDPNHPSSPAMEPLTQSLDVKVKARLAEEAKKNPSRRTFLISSEWSEASEPVTLPAGEHFYAVSTSPVKPLMIRDDLPLAVDKDASGKALAVVWSEQKAVDVPGVAEVHRGTVLSFVKDAEVVHPISATPRKVADYAFATDAVVADITGGETMKARNLRDESSLKSPGEMLVFDSKGNWHVLDETYDADARMRFAPEEESEEGEVRPRPRANPRAQVGPGAPGFGGPEGNFRQQGPPGSRQQPNPMQGYPQQPPSRTRGGAAPRK